MQISWDLFLIMGFLVEYVADTPSHFNIYSLANVSEKVYLASQDLFSQK